MCSTPWIPSPASLIYVDSSLGVHGTHLYLWPSRCMQIMPVLVCFLPVAVLKFYNQSNLRSKEFIWLTQPGPKPGFPSPRKDKAGVSGTSHEGTLLLALSLCWFCSASFPVQPRTHLPRDDAATVGWALLCSWAANTVPHIHSKRPI